MSERIENQNLAEIRPLASPRTLKAKQPLSERAAATVLAGRRAIRDVIHGRDARRLVVIVGPCSIHDADAAFEYGARLRQTALALEDQLVIAMRTYFEKPRTTVGWKGLINDPELDGSCRVERGLELARDVLLELTHLEVPCASEVIDPFTAAIPGRSADVDQHRRANRGESDPPPARQRSVDARGNQERHQRKPECGRQRPGRRPFRP